MEDKRQEQDYPWKNRARPAIYAMAGVYLLYLAYSMFKKISVTSGGEQTLMIVFTILFAVLGLALMLFGLIRGYRYTKEMQNAGQKDVKDKEE